MTISSDSELPRPGDTYVQSFARGLQVVRSFSAQAPQQTLSDVAHHTGLTRAGARRILLTLQTLGYVESDGRWFRLTARILDLGFAYLSSMPIWNLAEPAVEALVDQVKESSSIAVLDGSEIVYVMRVPTHKIMKISLGIGSRLPAFCTSLGRVLLSGLPDAELERRIDESNLEPLTRHTQTDKRKLIHEIHKVREQGWSLVNQELEEGLISVAAPLFGSAGKMVAAINISGQANRTEAMAVQKELLPPLLETAQRIGQLLRHKSV